MGLVQVLEVPCRARSKLGGVWGSSEGADILCRKLRTHDCTYSCHTVEGGAGLCGLGAEKVERDAQHLNGALTAGRDRFGDSLRAVNGRVSSAPWRWLAGEAIDFKWRN